MHFSSQGFELFIVILISQLVTTSCQMHPLHFCIVPPSVQDGDAQPGWPLFPTAEELTFISHADI